MTNRKLEGSTWIDPIWQGQRIKTYGNIQRRKSKIYEVIGQEYINRILILYPFCLSGVDRLMFTKSFATQLVENFVVHGLKVHEFHSKFTCSKILSFLPNIF